MNLIALFAHPLLTGLGIDFLIFGAIWLGAFNAFRKKSFHHFDPPHGNQTFEPHAKRYQDIGKMGVTLATASLAAMFKFISDFPATQYSANSLKIERASLLSALLFLSTILFLLIHITLMSLFYEDYCHAKNKDTLSPSRYALLCALGYSGLISFFLGYGAIFASLILQ